MKPKEEPTPEGSGSAQKLQEKEEEIKELKEIIQSYEKIISRKANASQILDSLDLDSVGTDDFMSKLILVRSHKSK